MAFASTDKSKFNFIKCGLCGTLTSNTVGAYGVCPSCVIEDQRLYSVARDAMSLNRNISLAELASKTGIEEKILRRWVDTGRLLSGR